MPLRAKSRESFPLNFSGIVSFHGKDCIVDEFGDVRPRCLVLQIGPTRLRWHPEDVLGDVLVAVFQQAIKLISTNPFRLQLASEFVTSRLERIGNILQKEEAKDHVFVFCCVDLSAQFVGGLPKNFGIG